MKNFLKPLTVALGLALGSQIATSQSVTYKVIDDDPTPKPLNINLLPFFCEAGGGNTAYIGWEAFGMLDIKKPLSFSATYRQSYGGKFAMTSDATFMPKKGLSGPHYFEAAGMFNFSNKKKARNIKVVLWSTSYTVGNTRYTNSKYIMVPGHIRKIWSLRASMIQFTNNVKYGDVDDMKKNGRNVLYGVNTKDNKDTISGFNGNSSLTTTMNGVAFAFGINSRSITDLLVNTDDYGRKATRSQTEWYIDYHIAPVLALKDVTDKTNTYNMYSEFKKRQGWRAGMIIRGAKRPYMSAKFEMGQRPGIKQDLFGTFYINFSVGLSIPAKIKAFEYED